MNQKTVLRGGVGVYAVPFIIGGVLQHGFSQATPLIASDRPRADVPGDAGKSVPRRRRRPCRRLPRREHVPGSDRSAGSRRPAFKNGENARYLINIQRELPGQWLLEAGYTGSRGWDITTELDLNPLPAQYLSTSRVRDQANIDFLAQLVPNPFAGLVPGGTINSATVARSQLLRPIPAVQRA